MGFYERITREQEPKIPVHTITALIGEWERGKLTLGQVSAVLGLSPAEEVEASTLLAKIIPPRECISFGGFVTLTNVGTAYDSISAAHGLGTALVQTSGITQVIFGVRVNKIGTGTQSWQLWNDTDASQVTVIDDAGASGIKNLSVTTNLGPLGAGMKVIRVRAKSTVAADDPIYFGATASIRRVSNLTALELHEILLLADITGGPYVTSTALKARLGIA